MLESLRSRIGEVPKIYEDLMEEGFTKKDIKKVYSPIGLAIKAESPDRKSVV